MNIPVLIDFTGTLWSPIIRPPPDLYICNLYDKKFHPVYSTTLNFHDRYTNFPVQKGMTNCIEGIMLGYFALLPNEIHSFSTRMLEDGRLLKLVEEKNEREYKILLDFFTKTKELTVKEINEKYDKGIYRSDTTVSEDGKTTQGTDSVNSQME